MTTQHPNTTSNQQLWELIKSNSKEEIKAFLTSSAQLNNKSINQIINEEIKEIDKLISLQVEMILENKASLKGEF